MAKTKTITVVKNHVLTGISYMLPLIVGAGVCMALGQVIGRIMGAEILEVEGSLPWVLVQIGAWGLGLIVPVICGAIAYSIADKPGIAPGIIIGFIANEIEAGFIGGILGGFVVGYLVLAIIKYVKVPKSMQGLMPIMIIPLLSITIGGLAMYFVIGTPIAYLQHQLINFLESMQGGSQFLFGGILGSMATFDFGGPVNKTMSMFADGLLVEGVYGPEAVKFVGSMIPPFGITLSYFLTKNKYTKAEKESLKAAFPMGIAMITEGVIPIAARDLVKVVGSCVLGSFIAGGLIMSWGVEAPVPHGGMFVVPIFTRPWLFLLALVIGSVICGVTLSIWKKPVTEEDEAFNELDDANVKDDEIIFSMEG